MPARSLTAAALFLAFAAAVPFLPALNGAFLHWDDRVFLFDNTAWRGFSVSSMRWMLTTTYCGPYQPLAWATYALTHRIWGLSPLAFHGVSLAGHAASTALFFLVLREILAKATPAAAPRERMFAAAFAALVWAVHPLRVESVAWIAEQRDVLCATFSLLTTLLYLRRPGSDPWILASLTLALLSKSSAVALPLTLLVLDAWPLGRLKTEGRAVFIEKIPMLLLAFAFAAMTFLGHRVDGAILSDPIVLRAQIALHNFGFYLVRILYPIGLSPYYPLAPDFSLGLAPAAAIAVAAAASWKCRREYPAVTAALAHYAAALLPMAGLMRVGGHLGADRYTLVASMGPAALAAGALLSARRRAPRAAMTTALLVTASLAALTWRAAKTWQDDASLWAKAVAYDPKSVQARLNLSAALRRAGRPDEAAIHERIAAELDPKLPGPWNNLAGWALSRGRWAEAETSARRALSLEPKLAAAHFNLACALQGLQRNDEALRELRRTLELEPSDPKARNNLALELLRRGSALGAVAELRRVVADAPLWAAARHNLGNALTVLGRHREAALAFDEAVHLDAALEEAWVNAGNAQARLGRYDEAARRYERALALKPDDAQARRNLAAVRRAAGS